MVEGGQGGKSCFDAGLLALLMQVTLQRRRQPSASSLMMEELGQICVFISMAEVLYYS